MGQVYRAHDSKIGRTVAIKISKGGDFDERFRKEAEVLAKLSHPHICTLLDTGPNYLVMEFIEGTPLSAVKTPLGMDKALGYADQVLDALDTAHRKGIIHRDLKPANVMINRHGTKLLDFGIAKKVLVQPPVDEATLTAMTRNGEIIGTPQYMAPELFLGVDADARSDLWAFGCLLYEMLSGRKPFGQGDRGGGAGGAGNGRGTGGGGAQVPGP